MSDPDNIPLPPSETLDLPHYPPADQINNPNSNIENPETFPTIPGFTLIKKLGQGGQGIVYQAMQDAPKRKVAIKILLNAPYASKSAKHRFEREIELVATLRHPNIVTVFNSGKTLDGHIYYAMDYVRGVPITDYVRKNKLALEKTLQLLATACEAVNHAHQKGIIHRDLKPANILVDDHEHLHILDFGLAKQLGDASESAQTLVSVTGNIMGTLAYMSPEQTKGNPDLLDIRTDVYALGVIFYELLTGTYPYPVLGEMAQTLNHIVNTAPQPLAKSWTSSQGATTSARNRRSACPIDDEVETIAMKALAKEKERRYQSAGELGRDIQHYLHNEPIEAKRDSGMYLLKRTLSKYRLAASVTILFLLLSVASTVLFWVLRNEAAGQRDSAQRASKEASESRDAALVANRQKDLALNEKETALSETRDQLIQSLSYQGAGLIDNERFPDAEDTLRRGMSLLSQSQLSPLWFTAPLFDFYDHSPQPLNPPLTFTGHTDSIRAIAIAPDNRTALSASYDKTLKLWDLATGNEIRTFPSQNQNTEALAISPDGRTALSPAARNTLRLWDLQTGDTLQTLAGHTALIHRVAFFPDGKTAISCGADRTFKLWNLRTGQLIRSFTASQTSGVRGIAVSPDQRTVLSAGGDAILKLWDLASGAELRDFKGHLASVNAVAFLPGGLSAVTAAGDGTLKLWDLQTGNEIRTLRGHGASVYDLALLPDGRTALSASLDRTLRLWDLPSGKCLRTLSGHTGCVRTVALSSDGRTALSGADDKTLKRWDLAADAEARRDLAIFPGHNGPIADIAISPDGRTALTASDDRTLKLWDLATAGELRTFHGHTNSVHSVAFSPDGRSALSASYDKTLKLWDLATGTLLRTFSGHTGNIERALFSPDGKTALSASTDNTLILWNLATGQPMRTFFTDHTAGVRNLALSPDGKIALSTGRDTTLKLWDLATGRELRTLTGHRNIVEAVAFAPDGKTALSACNDNSLKLWDLASGAEIRSFTGHTGSAHAVAFFPDGRTAISVSSDQTMKLWDVSTGKEIRTFAEHAAWVQTVAISPNGLLALSAGGDRTLKAWDFSRPDAYLQFADQLSTARESRAADPDDTSARLTFGQWYAFRRADLSAANELERGRKAGAQVSPLLLGQCYWRLNRYPEALAEYQNALHQKEAPDFYLHLCINALQHAATQPASTRANP